MGKKRTLNTAKPKTNALYSQTKGYERWLSLEADSHELLISYPSEPMTIVANLHASKKSSFERAAESLDWQASLEITHEA